MKYFFLLFMTLKVSASDLNSMVPFHFEQTMPPLNKTVRIEIINGKKDLFAVNYAVTQNGTIKKLRKEFSKKIIEQVFLKLNNNSYKNINNWISDSDCIVKERFRLQFKNTKKEICTNQNLIKTMKDFQSSLEIIMH